ncbi:replication protein [Chloroflexota bacterium]
MTNGNSHTTPVPNDLLEALAAARLTGKELTAVIFLLRRTIGWSVNGNRCSNDLIALSDWTTIMQTDKANASRILTSLTNRKIINRVFCGPGVGYYYSINPAVVEWENSCTKYQQLLNNTTLFTNGDFLPEGAKKRQRLSKSTTVVLSKSTTPANVNLRLPKIKENNTIYPEDRGNGNNKKDGRPSSDPDKYVKGKYGHMVKR